MTLSTNRERNAIARAARDPYSRRKFLALTGGTGAAATFLAACGDDDEMAATTTDTGETGSDDVIAEKFGEGDVGIVNYALTLEYLEAGFYKAVADSGLFKGDDLALIKTIGDQEQQHVDALTATLKDLNADVAPEPNAEFPLDSAADVLNLAATVENLGAAAYLGQAANIENPDILAAALSIHANEARHAAVLNVLIDESPTPDGAFAVGAEPAEVLEQVQPFIKS